MPAEPAIENNAAAAAAAPAPPQPDAPGPLVARGAVISTAYAEREVKAYAVFESELSSISMFNGLATTFFSVAAAALSYAMGIYTNAAFVDKMPAEGIVMAKVVGPLLIVGTIIFVVLGVWAVKKRASIWNEISRASKRP